MCAARAGTRARHVLYARTARTRCTHALHARASTRSARVRRLRIAYEGATDLANAAGESSTPAHCGHLAAAVCLHQLLAQLWAVEPVGQSSQPVAPHIHCLHRTHFPDTPVRVRAHVSNGCARERLLTWRRTAWQHADHATHTRTRTRAHTAVCACVRERAIETKVCVCKREREP